MKLESCVCLASLLVLWCHVCSPAGYDLLLPNIDPEPKNISQAIVYVIENFFAKRTPSLVLNAETVTIDGEDYVLDIIDEVLRHITSMTVQLDLFSQLDIQLIRRYNVFFVDSYEAFRTIFSEMTEDAYDFTGYYLIYYLANDTDRYTIMTKMFEDFWSILIVNVNIILEPVPNMIQIYTYFPFNRFHCRQIGPTLINRFIGNEMQKETLYPSKITNFHQCPLNIYLWAGPPHMLVGEENGVHYIRGVEGDMLHALAKKMNFTINIVYGWPNVTERGDVLPNGTAYGSFNMLLSPDVDIIAGGYEYTIPRVQRFSATVAYYTTAVVFAVPSGVPYDAVEVLFFPFEDTVWINVVACFGIGIVIIIFVRFMKQFVRPFVVGRRNPTPILNMFITILGGPVEPAPGRNFARFILMMWLIATLVLRSLYQSALYYFLKTEKVKQPPANLDDLYENDYTIYLRDDYYAPLEGTPGIIERAVTLNGTFRDGFEMLLKTHENLAVCCTYDVLTYFNTRHWKRGIIHAVKERLFPHVQCMYLKKFSYITLPLDELLLNFRSAGLIKRWSLKYYDERFNRPEKQSPTPKQFNLHQLAGAYQIFAIFVGISVFIFVLEMLSMKVKLLKKFLDFIH